MKKLDRVYVPHPNFRFPTEPLYRIAHEIIYVCDTPMFDDMIGNDHKHKFEGSVWRKMEDYDPESDAIAFYGDAIVFAMMVLVASDRSDTIRIARYSQKLDEYVVREINIDEDWHDNE
jgi:hypothetical protein